VNFLARERHSQREEEALSVHSADVDPDLGEANLDAPARKMSLRNKPAHHTRRFSASSRISGRRAATYFDTVRYGDRGSVLVDQPLPDPARDMPLLG
jgi:hypothetical protein